MQLPCGYLICLNFVTSQIQNHLNPTYCCSIHVKKMALNHELNLQAVIHTLKWASYHILLILTVQQQCCGIV